MIKFSTDLITNMFSYSRKNVFRYVPIVVSVVLFALVPFSNNLNFQIFVSILFCIQIFVYICGMLVGFFSKPKNIVEDFKTSDFVHFCTIPVLNENLSTVLLCLNSIYNQNYPKNNIVVLISIEQHRTSSNATKFALILTNLIKTDFPEFTLGTNIFVEIHTLDTLLETKGAAANRSFAAKKMYSIYQKDFLDKFAIITSPDADSILSNNYFLETAQKFESKNEFIIAQTKNYFFRNTHKHIIIESISLLISAAIYSRANLYSNGRYTFSCFSMSLDLLSTIDFYDSKNPIDDTTLYWRITKTLKKTPQIVCLDSSVQVGVVESKSFFEAIQKQYSQLYRWSCGIVVFPMSISAILQTKQSVSKKMIYLCLMIEYVFLTRVLIFLGILNLTLNYSKLDLWGLVTLISLQLSIIFTIIFYVKKYRQRITIYKLILIVVGIYPTILITFLADIHAFANLARSKMFPKKLVWSAE